MLFRSPPANSQEALVVIVLKFKTRLTEKQKTLTASNFKFSVNRAKNYCFCIAAAVRYARPTLSRNGC